MFVQCSNLLALLRRATGIYDTATAGQPPRGSGAKGQGQLALTNGNKATNTRGCMTYYGSELELFRGTIAMLEATLHTLNFLNAVAHRLDHHNNTFLNANTS